MKTFYTSVVELRQHFPGRIRTHPYECGWADEAIFFVDLHDPRPGDVLVLRTQLSADGIRWLDEGGVIETNTSAFTRVRHFGGFLRLAGGVHRADGTETGATVSVRLALKG